MSDPRRDGVRQRRASRVWWLVGLAIAAAVVILLAPLASSDPDGLERVAQDQGFIETAQDVLYQLIPEYSVPGMDGNGSTILAGLIGVIVVFALMIGLGKLLTRRRG